MLLVLVCTPRGPLSIGMHLDKQVILLIGGSSWILMPSYPKIVDAKCSNRVFLRPLGPSSFVNSLPLAVTVLYATSVMVLSCSSSTRNPLEIGSWG
jgi:hypothetical protein